MKTVKIRSWRDDEHCGRMRCDRTPQYKGPCEDGPGLLYSALHRIRRADGSILWVERYCSIWDRGDGCHEGEQAVALDPILAAETLERWGHKLPDELAELIDQKQERNTQICM